MLAAASMLVVGAASPAPDLSAYLAPVSSDWIEDSAAPDVIDGPFTAHDWGAYVEDTAAESMLNRYGFVAGYGRAWQQKVTQDYLVERVFQFTSSKGAGYALHAFRLGEQTDKDFKRDLPAWDAATSYGDELAYTGHRSFRFYFVKDALFFVVHITTSNGNDLSQVALAIAHTEYDMAPAAIGPAASGPTSSSGMPPMAGWVIGLLVLAFVILASVAIFALLRRRSAGAGVASLVQMSSDGAYWWDGVRWRSAVTDVPPQAQRSPDGAYWWDGKTWRRTGS